jgi:hypothetical protein
MEKIDIKTELLNIANRQEIDFETQALQIFITHTNMPHSWIETCTSDTEIHRIENMVQAGYIVLDCNVVDIKEQ